MTSRPKDGFCELIRECRLVSHSIRAVNMAVFFPDQYLLKIRFSPAQDVQVSIDSRLWIIFLHDMLFYCQM
jgi:hypothetical protein